MIVERRLQSTLNGDTSMVNQRVRRDGLAPIAPGLFTKKSNRQPVRRGLRSQMPFMHNLGAFLPQRGCVLV